MRWRGLFRRRTTTAAGADTRSGVDEQHLLGFVASRKGVEGFVEPRTTVTDPTLLLIAHDGEWTRRRVPSEEWAHRFARRHGFPCYDAAIVGYPDRMREYNRRQRTLDVPDHLEE